MPHELDTGAITQKGKISATGAWLVLVDIRTKAGVGVKRIVNNTENVTYAGLTYYAVPFRLSQIKESVKGELPKVTLSVYDANLDFRPQLQLDDGLSGGEIDIRRVFFYSATSYADTGLLQYFTIIDAAWDDSESVIHFNIGVSNLLAKRFPRDRYISLICRHIFRGGMCRYGEDNEGTFISNKITLYSAPLGYDYVRVFSSEADYQKFDVDQMIKISGSGYNNGIYRIHHKIYGEQSGYGRYYLYTNKRFSQSENSNSALVITLKTQCDHSLVQCRANNNSHMYGSSPGVAEGLYG